jgi:hypothetical protein
MNDAERFALALKGIINKRLTDSAFTALCNALRMLAACLISAETNPRRLCVLCVHRVCSTWE